MMSANYVSTLMLSSSLRYSITGHQSALSKASKEATTGRFADPGLQLERALARYDGGDGTPAIDPVPPAPPAQKPLAKTRGSSVPGRALE